MLALAFHQFEHTFKRHVEHAVDIAVFVCAEHGFHRLAAGGLDGGAHFDNLFAAQQAATVFGHGVVLHLHLGVFVTQHLRCVHANQHFAEFLHQRLFLRFAGAVPRRAHRQTRHQGEIEIRRGVIFRLFANGGVIAAIGLFQDIQHLAGVFAHLFHRLFGCGKCQVDAQYADAQSRHQLHFFHLVILSGQSYMCFKSSLHFCI